MSGEDSVDGRAEIRATLSYVMHEGRTVPQLRVEKQTIEGLESITITRFTEKFYDCWWECQYPGVASKKPQMLIMYDIHQVTRNIQQACTGSLDEKLRDMLSFCPPLLVYANQRIKDRGN